VVGSVVVLFHPSSNREIVETLVQVLDGFPGDESAEKSQGVLDLA
jgi:hypothetical protein